jgi:hypothetical protein
MRLISLSGMISLALLSSAVAQQGAGTAGDAIGHPPPLAGPPPAPAQKGYLGAYGPPGPATPYSTGPLPQTDANQPGLNVAGPDGVSTRTVKAVPCGRVARETDGFTTCVGIPEQSPKTGRR